MTQAKNKLKMAAGVIGKMKAAEAKNEPVYVKCYKFVCGSDAKIFDSNLLVDNEMVRDEIIGPGPPGAVKRPSRSP
jgi:hypothetical protein